MWWPGQRDIDARHQPLSWPSCLACLAPVSWLSMSAKEQGRNGLDWMGLEWELESIPDALSRVGWPGG